MSFFRHLSASVHTALDRAATGRVREPERADAPGHLDAHSRTNAKPTSGRGVGRTCAFCIGRHPSISTRISRLIRRSSTLAA